MQREINLSIYNNKKVRKNNNSHKKEFHRITNSQRNSKISRRFGIDDTPKTEMNSNLQHIVNEFKLCPDINVVSKKIGIPASKIKKWYNKKDGEYKLFHDAIVKLNPNMDIKNDFDLNSLSILDQFDYVTSSFKKHKNIKLVSEHTGVSENQIQLWIKLGKSGLFPYKHFYDKISKFM